MPEEAVRWNDSPWGLQGEDSDVNEEEHNTWNRGLGLFTLQDSSPKIQQYLKKRRNARLH